jgi:hypothetical protein
VILPNPSAGAFSYELGYYWGLNNPIAKVSTILEEFGGRDKY